MASRMSSQINYRNRLFVKLLAIALIARSTLANSLAEFDPHSRFVCPPMPATCSCSFVISDIEIQCPISEPNIIVRIQPQTYVQIECATMDENDYALLPAMNIGDIPMVQIRRCPLPRGQSLDAILERIGTRRVRSLLFQSYGTDLGSTLVRQHLKGFGYLERLVLSGNGLSDLPADLFNDLGNLTWLDLKSNKVHLPRDIFVNLEKLDYLELGYNKLQNLEAGIFRSQKRLKHLNLWGNDLKNLTKSSFDGIPSIVDLDLSTNKLKYLEANVFHLLKNLTNLNLSGNNFTSLPEGLFTENRNLTRLRLLENREKLSTLPSGLLSNLTELEEVRIKCYLSSVPDNLFSGSVNLRLLALSGNELETLPGSLFADQINLLDLDLSRNMLVDLDDDLFANVPSLLVLALSHNKLVNISSNVLSHLKNLKGLYLDNNNLHNIHANAFVATQRLKIIDLRNNYLTFRDGAAEFEGELFEIGSPFQNLNELQTLNLRNNSISSIFRDWIYNTARLEVLDLSYNNFTMISNNDLQFASQLITVNLSHNAIEEIDFRDIQYMVPVAGKEISVHLGDNPVMCNCIILHFVQFIAGTIAKSMQKNLKIMPGELICTGPEALTNRYVTTINPLELLCPLDSEKSSIKRCPDKCLCSVRPVDKALILNCSNVGLTSVPDLPRAPALGLHFIELHIENNRITKLPEMDHPGYADVNEIYAKNNNITRFTVDNIPENLTVLDLSNNFLSRINTTVFKAFNRSNQLKSLSLGNNPWECDCNSIDLLSFVRTNFKRIQDLETMQCKSGDKLSSISQSDFCEEDQTILITVCVVIAFFGIFIGIVASLYYRYQTEVKVWLFAHNICLWFVTEEELDKDKKYDAFVSYSHKDEDFIAEHLVPNLENGPTPFKLCLHVRDWIVGEFIPNQIIKSVEDSRRTIVVLSPNFIESIWGRMEFRAAHSAALKEGRARVIVVIYGDIGDTARLDPELKAYLNMNTYVKWNDPWFWDKLRYAMPHPSSNHGRTKGLVKTAIKSSTDDKLELIKPASVTPPPTTTPPAEQAGKNPLATKFNAGNDITQNGKISNGINGHVNGAFIINTNAKQSDV